MSMNYVVRKKVDKSGDKEVVRYYAASKAKYSVSPDLCKAMSWHL